MENNKPYESEIDDSVFDGSGEDELKSADGETLSDGESNEEDTPSDFEENSAEDAQPVKLSKRSVILISILSVLLISAFILIRVLGGENCEKTDYNENKTWESWSANYALLDGEMTHTIHPAGTNVIIYVESESGELSIEITDSKGNVVFEKENAQSGFSIDADSKMKIKITAKNHKGKFRIG